MPKKKQAEVPAAPQPEPGTPEWERSVGCGCPDCLHYGLPASAKPCKGCKRWSHWVVNPDRPYAKRRK